MRVVLPKINTVSDLATELEPRAETCFSQRKMQSLSLLFEPRKQRSSLAYNPRPRQLLTPIGSEAQC